MQHKKSIYRKISDILTPIIAVLIVANMVTVISMSIQIIPTYVGLVLGPTTMFISGTNLVLLTCERRRIEHELKRYDTFGKTSST